GATAAAQLALAAALVATTGVLFLIAGAARLGGISDFIARPVLRGFTFGLALTIVIKQLPKILVVPVHHSDTPHVFLDLLRGLSQANPSSVVVGAFALPPSAKLSPSRISRAPPGFSALLTLPFRYLSGSFSARKRDDIGTTKKDPRIEGKHRCCSRTT
ncbi:SulP family inorganic anion transporter, partial [Paraburkholderia bryophila]|uniref:SulP family inorganic anion transporter n=1 Tax=Paraburkholderia bryophila TaxID=420952 RepID=UPI001FC7D72B